VSSTAITISVAPQPTDSTTFDLVSVRKVIHGVFALSALSALFKVILTQTQDAPRDLHQFQIYFRDARVWIDQIEFVPPHQNLTSPRLTRESRGDSFTNAEWRAITVLRDDILAMHNELREPDLISVALGPDNALLLLADPLTATAGQGTVRASWIAPTAGHVDWIGLFRVGDPNTAYLAYYTIPDGDFTDHHDFPTPGTAGSYEFRYLVANGFTSIAKSPTFVVS